MLACRINGAVYQTLKLIKPQLLSCENVLIDTKSFADNIRFTWKRTAHNVLNTYYGAQAFEEWMFEGMVGLVTRIEKKPVFVATGPVERKADTIEFVIFDHPGYRQVSQKKVILPIARTVVVDFDLVYGRGTEFHKDLRLLNR